MFGRFAREVSGIEFRERGVDVVEVENYARREPFVGIVLDKLEDIDLDRLRIGPRGPQQVETEAVTASRNGFRREVRPHPEVNGQPYVFDREISAVSDSGIHGSTAIVAEVILGKVLGHGVPVTLCEMLEKAFQYNAFQPRRAWMQLLESGEGGI